MDMTELEQFAVRRSVVAGITVVRGISPREACRRWGTTKHRGIRRYYDEFIADASDIDDPDHFVHPWIAAWEVGPATVVWEPTAPEGTSPEALAAITEGGVEAFSVTAMHEQFTEFLHAQNPVILAQFKNVPGRSGLLHVRGEEPQRVLWCDCATKGRSRQFGEGRSTTTWSLLLALGHDQRGSRLCRRQEIHQAGQKH